MNPALWGLISAASWGSADFVARISGQALGPARSLFGMIGSGILFLVIWAVATDLPLGLPTEGLHWLLINGAATMASMLLLYAGLFRGPIAVAAPLVGTYPVFVVLGGLVLGIVPTGAQWIAMAAVMAGVWMVATTGHPQTLAERPRGGVGLTVAYSLVSAISFAVAIFAAREAVPIYGDVQSVLFTRIVSFVCLLGVMTFNREAPLLPRRWWTAVTVQGGLDTLGMFTMFVGSVGGGAPLAAVGSAPVAVFTVILARIFLAERVPLKQWLGIVIVVAGGGALAYLSWQ